MRPFCGESVAAPTTPRELIMLCMRAHEISDLAHPDSTGSARRCRQQGAMGVRVCVLMTLSSIGRCTSTSTQCNLCDLCVPGTFQNVSEELTDILQSHPPHLIASAEGWDAARQELIDRSGNGNAGRLQAGTVTVGVEKGCQIGQGESGGKIAQSNENTYSACLEQCRATPGCTAFDYTTTYQSESCRLYGPNSPRLGSGGIDNRQYCEMRGHGASIAVPYVGGTSATEVAWGRATIPSHFTICSVSRYSGMNRKRILQCQTQAQPNWLHGHWMGHAGVAQYDFWLTASGSSPSSSPAVVLSPTDWVVSCGRNVATSGSPSFVVNQATQSVAGGAPGDCALGINYLGWTNEKSDWQLSKLYVWDGHLPDDIFANVSRRLNNYLAATQCTVCESGKFSNTFAATQCTACAVGKYSNTSGATQCTACEAGKFSNTSGPTQCMACEIGKFSNISGATQCTA